MQARDVRVGEKSVSDDRSNFRGQTSRVDATPAQKSALKLIFAIRPRNSSNIGAYGILVVQFHVPHTEYIAQVLKMPEGFERKKGKIDYWDDVNLVADLPGRVQRSGIHL